MIPKKQKAKKPYRFLPHILSLSFLLASVLGAFLILYLNSRTSDTSAVINNTIATTNITQESSMALGADGFARVTYFGGLSLNLYFVQCTNTACTTKNTTDVDTGGSVGRYSSVAMDTSAGGDGFARISYESQADGDLKFIQCTNADCSTRNTTTLDTVGSVGFYTSTVIDPTDHFARISYTDNTNAHLKYIRCTNASCSTNVMTVVDTASGTAGFSSLALDSSPGGDGFARISEFDASFNLRLVQCTDADCSTHNITVVDSISGRYTSLALDPTDHFARISYYNQATGDLKFAQCTDATCSTHNITTVDSTDDVGWYPSLALDTSVGGDGFARISYYDNTHAFLKYAQCTDATCAGRNVTTIFNTQAVGQNTTIKIDPTDHFARISYLDQTNHAMKFAQCIDAACSGFPPTAPTSLIANTGTATAQVAPADPTALTSSDIVFSAIYHDPDTEAGLQYQLQVATDNLFNSIVYDSGANISLAANAVDGARSSDISSPAVFAQNTTYYWRIRFWDAGNTGTGAWSPSGGSAASFKTNPDLSITLTDLDYSTDLSGLYSSIAVGLDGFSRISYYNQTTGDLKYVQCTNATCSTRVLTTIDSTGDVGMYTSIKVASDGFARISYYDNTNGDLKFVKCGDAACTPGSATFTTIDSATQVGQYTSLVLGSDGFARISYYDATPGNKGAGTIQDLKFVQCTNATCSTNVISTVDSTGNVGMYTSLALGSDGFARISYYDSTNADLKFAQCTNATCSTNVLTTVDSFRTVGSYSSIAMASDGFARISYSNPNDGDLKFAQCTNATCSTNVLTTVDSVGTVGDYTSLSMASDGFARISYYDATNTAVKVAACTNTACSTNTLTTIQTGGNVGQYTAMTLVSDIPQITYFHGLPHYDLTLAQCSTSTCAAAVVNIAPTANSVSITGTVLIGQTLTGHYTYADTESDPQGTSTFRWLRDGATAISGATALTYTIVPADMGHTVVFEVTPVATTGTTPGTPVPSSATISVPGVSCINAPTGLVSWWPGDGNTSDRQGTDTGQLNNGATFASGQVSQGFSFDGVNDSMTASDAGFPSGNADRTIIAWVKTAATGEKYFLSYGTNSATNAFAVGVLNNKLTIAQSGTNISSNASINDNNFHLVAVTYSGTGDSYKLYIDGVLDKTATMTTSTTLGGSLYLGRYLTASNYFAGVVDEVMVYNRALNFSNINALYNAGAVCHSINELLNLTDTVTRQTTSVDANHTLVFTTPSGIPEDSTLTVTFPTGFNLSTLTEDDVDIQDDGVDLTTATTCTGSEKASVVISGQIVTVTICNSDGGAIAPNSVVTVKIGTNATQSGVGSHMIANPATAANYLVSIGGTFGEAESLSLPIVDSDQVTESASITPYITFDLDTGISVGETLPPYTVYFGNLSPLVVSSSDHTSINSVYLDLNTNAYGGAIVTVKGAYGGLKSTIVNSLITTTDSGTAVPLSAGTEGFGLCIASTSAVGGAITKTAPYNGSCDATTHNIGGITTSPRTLFTSAGAPVDGTANDTAEVMFKTSIAPTTKAATDYTEVITFIATGSF